MGANEQVWMTVDEATTIEASCTSPQRQQGPLLALRAGTTDSRTVIY
jgi:hypothetical protein